jgi:hypothetical protein
LAVAAARGPPEHKGSLSQAWTVSNAGNIDKSAQFIKRRVGVVSQELRGRDQHEFAGDVAVGAGYVVGRQCTGASPRGVRGAAAALKPRGDDSAVATTLEPSAKILAVCQ